MIPQDVIAQLNALEAIGGSWFDTNPFDSEYLYPEAWSDWDWVQFGGASRLDAPLQIQTQTQSIFSGTSASGINVSTGLPPLNGPFTFLTDKIHGRYEIYIDKKTTPGKPTTKTALFAKDNEIKVRLYLITPFDVICARLLLQHACAIFPADAFQSNPQVIPIFYPSLSLFQRNRFILVSMDYVHPPTETEFAYTDTTWIPQDVIGTASSTGVVPPTGIVGANPPSQQQNQVGTFPTSGQTIVDSFSPQAQTGFAEPPPVADPFTTGAFID